MCEAFLAAGAEAYGAVSDQLARIAQHYRFDGWLINIENTLSVSSTRTPPASCPRSLPLAGAQSPRLRGSHAAPVAGGSLCRAPVPGP